MAVLEPDTKWEAYLQGCLDGLTAFAWWQDGTQYVGSCGTTLADARTKAKQFKLHCQRAWAKHAADVETET